MDSKEKKLYYLIQLDLLRLKIYQTFWRRAISKVLKITSSAHRVSWRAQDLRLIRQSAKTADWLVDNDVIWPVLRNCACANPGKLKIDRSMAAERERAMRNYKDLQDCCS